MISARFLFIRSSVFGLPYQLALCWFHALKLFLIIFDQQRMIISWSRQLIHLQWLSIILEFDFICANILSCEFVRDERRFGNLSLATSVRSVGPRRLKCTTWLLRIFDAQFLFQLLKNFFFANEKEEDEKTLKQIDGVVDVENNLGTFRIPLPVG